MYSFRKLQAIVLGHADDCDHDHEKDALCSTLKASDVPVSLADCRSCSDPCDLGHHEAYPRRFDIDMDTQMLGSVKPYHRQIVISTGRSDWEREVTEATGSLAAYMLQVSTSSNLNTPKPSSPPSNGKSSSSSTGLFNPSQSTRTSILNGSHNTLCHEEDHETVLIFPDFKVASEVRRSMQGAQDLWDSSVAPGIGRGGAFLEKSTLRTWVLPYACVILLCSHKKRDNRCGIAAPKLEHAFITSLESQGWDAVKHVECPSLTMGPPLEEMDVTPEEREENIASHLRDSTESKRALIIKTSHVGGHKYAGNCIIYTPSGSGVWYGRVTPHDVDSIVENTIIKGLVLPPLLRGGLNLSRPNCKSLNDW